METQFVPPEIASQKQLQSDIKYTLCIVKDNSHDKRRQVLELFFP